MALSRLKPNKDIRGRLVANLTRADAGEFLALAPKVLVKTTVVPMKLDEATRCRLDSDGKSSA